VLGCKSSNLNLLKLKLEYANKVWEIIKNKKNSCFFLKKTLSKLDGDEIFKKKLNLLNSKFFFLKCI
jgi:hypothetical protein